MATILEALQNADYNLQNLGNLSRGLTKVQLHNATVLLDKGYDPEDDVEELIGEGKVEDVPDNPDKTFDPL